MDGPLPAGGALCAVAQRVASADLAVAAGVTERYVREWLEQQAVSAILDVEDEQAGAAASGSACSTGSASPTACSSGWGATEPSVRAR